MLWLLKGMVQVIGELKKTSNKEHKFIGKGKLYYEEWSRVVVL
jgi:hypothetical protein